MLGFVLTFSEGYFERLYDYLDILKKLKIVERKRNYVIFYSNEKEYFELKNKIEKDKRKIFRYIGNLYPFSEVSDKVYLEVNRNISYRIISNIKREIVSFLNINLRKRNYDKIISIFKMGNKFYFGIFNKGFELRKPKEDFTPICRSYYKIEEAFKVFNIKKVNRVLDIGSAPGGWIQFLHNRAKLIVAVDPAELKVNYNNDIHIKKKVEEAIEEISKLKPYDLITCDINTNPLDVFEKIKELFVFLNKEGSVIFTIKLIYKSKRRNQKLVEETIKNFGKYFEEVKVEWLFANRKYERTLFAKFLVK